MTLSDRQRQTRALIESRQNERRQGQVISASRRTSRPRIDTAGNIIRDGSDSPERPKGYTGNRATGSGKRVSESGGEVIGQSGANNGQLLAALRATQQQLIEAINTIPVRLIEGDPNAQDPELLPQYLDDLVYDRTSETVFRWDDINTQWEALGSWSKTEEIRGYIPATENGTIELGGTNSYALKVVAVRKSGPSAAILTTSPGIDSTVAAGSQLTLITANADGSAVGFTVELERV